MHHVGRKVITSGGAADADRTGDLDPPFILHPLIHRFIDAAGGAVELNEGVTLVSATGHYLVHKTVIGGFTGVFGLAIGFLGNENRRLLVDAIAQRILPGNTAVVGVNGGHDTVLGNVGNREIVDGQIDIRLCARLDTGWQQGRNFVGIGTILDFQHRPIEDVAGVALDGVSHECLPFVC